MRYAVIRYGTEYLLPKITDYYGIIIWKSIVFESSHFAFNNKSGKGPNNRLKEVGLF